VAGSRPTSFKFLREHNHLRVVDVLHRRGEASRAEIARQTGLSRTTVSTIVTELLETGLVIERAATGASAKEGQVGRPPVLLALDPTSAYAVGVDFDHHRILVAVADLSLQVLAEREAGWDVDHDATGAIARAAELVDEVLVEAGVDRDRVLGTGVALAAPVDHEAGAIHSSGVLPSWVGRDVMAELQAALGTEVRIDNDANLGALAEVTRGAATKARFVAYVSISSGIGAGLAIDGRPYRGFKGIAGEFGHILMDPNGTLCRCGNRGCLETLAAGPALSALYGTSRGVEVTIPELVALAQEGDAGSSRVIADAGLAVGQALACLVTIMGPETVVVGGELSEAGEILLEPMRRAVLRYAPPASTRELTIVPGALGGRASLIGAIALVLTQSTEVVASRIAEAMAS